MTFKGRITDGKLTVRNADGDKVSIGQGKVVDGKRAVRARLKDGLKKGSYTASMSVLHTDGHVMNKSWNFKPQVRNDHEEDRHRRSSRPPRSPSPPPPRRHVTLQPREAASGSFSKMDVRVPNERDNKGTIKVDVRLPDGFYFLSYQKVPGWKARVFKEKLDQPVDLGGFEVDEQFTRIVWTASKPQARPHRARASSRTSRSRSACPTARPAAQLVFRAFQTYQRGERVAWTGAPDSDTPAPRVTLLAPEEE